MSPDMTRRQILEGTAAAAVSAAMADGISSSASAQESGATPRAEIEVPLNVNGTVRRAKIDPRSTLLDTLRENIGLTGTKKGCDRGECGACTVHIDGRRALSCLTLAVMAEGREITTIEGLAEGAELHPVQAAFIEHDAFQCGYCTSGQIMSSVACIREGHAGSDDEVREFMSGNICRCSAYPQIVAAVRSTAETKDI